MQPFLAGFADELTKVGASSAEVLLRRSMVDKNDPTIQEITSSEIRSPAKSYARTMLLGAIVAPVMTLLSRRIGRFVHNRDVMRAIGETIGAAPKAKLMKQLRVGPMIGSAIGRSAHTMPTVTHSEFASDVFSGAAGGSIIQALRDKLGS